MESRVENVAQGSCPVIDSHSFLICAAASSDFSTRCQGQNVMDREELQVNPRFFVSEPGVRMKRLSANPPEFFDQ